MDDELADPTGGGVGDNGGVDHYGFVLVDPADLDDAVKRLVELGATYLRDSWIAPDWRTSFLRDPDGYVFQVL